MGLIGCGKTTVIQSLGTQNIDRNMISADTDLTWSISNTYALSPPQPEDFTFDSAIPALFRLNDNRLYQQQIERFYNPYLAHWESKLLFDRSPFDCLIFLGLEYLFDAISIGFHGQMTNKIQNDYVYSLNNFMTETKFVGSFQINLISQKPVKSRYFLKEMKRCCRNIYIRGRFLNGMRRAGLLELLLHLQIWYIISFSSKLLHY